MTRSSIAIATVAFCLVGLPIMTQRSTEALADPTAPPDGAGGRGTPGTLPFGTVTLDSQGNVYGVAHGEQGEGNYQAVFWKLSGLGDNTGGGGSGPPANLAAPKMRPPSRRSTVVNNTEPTFKWSPVHGAASYELLVMDITPGISEGNSITFDQKALTGTSFTRMLPLNPAHLFAVQVRAIDSAGQPGPWSNAPHFKIAEQKTRYYRIRLDSSTEGATAVFGAATFDFTIQALEDSKGRPALGPPRLVNFKGGGLGIPTPLPVSHSFTSTWDDFTLPKAMTVDSLAGAGAITLGAAVSLGPVGFSSKTVLDFSKPGNPITDSLNVNSSGIGLTGAIKYVGEWKVEKAPHYDLTLWPNTLFPDT